MTTFWICYLVCTCRLEAAGGETSMTSKMSGYRFGPTSPPPTSPITSSAFVAPSEDRSEKSKETDELIAKQEREVRDCVKELLAALGLRDQVLAASRRAFQRLNRECKLAISTTLRKIVDREKEALAARQFVVDKLEAAVESLDENTDEADYIREYADDDPQAGLVLCSQALSILGDVNILERQNQELQMNSDTGGGAPLPAPPRFPMEEGGQVAPVNKRPSTSPPEPKVVAVSMEETTMHFSKVFFLAEWPEGVSRAATPVELLDIFLCDERLPGEDEATTDLRTALQRLSAMKGSLEGRKMLVNVLNQFRSKQVGLGLLCMWLLSILV
jgi:hypothetical protein